MDGHYPNGTLNYSSGHAPIATSQSHHGLSSHYPQAAYQTSHQPLYNLPSLAPLQSQKSSGSYTHGHMPQRNLIPSHQLPSSQTSQPSYLHYPTTLATYAPTQQNQTYSLNSNYAQQHSLQPTFQHNNASMPELSRLPSIPYQFGGIAPTNATANGQPLRTLSMSLATLDSSRRPGNHGIEMTGPETFKSENVTHPAHVVGSQGRRGILPSAEGRPSAVQNVDVGASGQMVANGKNANIPSKDADGKFPCLHCNKTYLHAKHLKRHLLRRKYSESV